MVQQEHTFSGAIYIRLASTPAFVAYKLQTAKSGVNSWERG